MIIKVCKKEISVSLSVWRSIL